MSKHFAGRKDAERTTGLTYLLSPSRVQSPGELRFRRHGYVRCGFAIGMVLYFVYCNPEYSYTYTALRQRCGWDMTEPIFPQYLTLQPSRIPSSSTAREQQPPPQSPSSSRSSAVGTEEKVRKKEGE
ncbi:conserved hypothetical protein [Leishmania mexicana MHOM/GT/2001/U1103]|uniref:Uncharacterized protein n=1 Tax=Leishmania mexicana (strain MHOM/GT/2001/U1103) TaxID=929439 RepID=E9AML8_LEIMU|nr:conserved hypothetical protein [Leishmania mexicana MHOM/GT/2001/U1103]CBZ24173.1 conserved hypothetical protein [Leishmania mexicana MHOM/GT/2001/U1103]